MKLPHVFLFVLISVMLSSCGVVEGIFKAGMWWAIILISALVGVVLFIYFKAKRK